MPSPATPAGSSIPATAGGNVTSPAPDARTSAASRAGSARSAPDATTSRPPAASARHTSHTAASKLNDANCTTAAPGDTANSRRCAATRFTTPP